MLSNGDTHEYEVHWETLISFKAQLYQRQYSRDIPFLSFPRISEVLEFRRLWLGSEMKLGAVGVWSMHLRWNSVQCVSDRVGDWSLHASTHYMTGRLHWRVSCHTPKSFISNSERLNCTTEIQKEHTLQIVRCVSQYASHSRPTVGPSLPPFVGQPWLPPWLHP